MKFCRNRDNKMKSISCCVNTKEMIIIIWRHLFNDCDWVWFQDLSFIAGDSAVWSRHLGHLNSVFTSFMKCWNSASDKPTQTLFWIKMRRLFKKNCNFCRKTISIFVHVYEPVVEKFTAAFTEECFVIVINFLEAFSTGVGGWCTGILWIGYVRPVGHMWTIVIARWHRLMLHWKVWWH